MTRAIERVSSRCLGPTLPNLSRGVRWCRAGMRPTSRWTAAIRQAWGTSWRASSNGSHGRAHPGPRHNGSSNGKPRTSSSGRRSATTCYPRSIRRSSWWSFRSLTRQRTISGRPTTSQRPSWPRTRPSTKRWAGSCGFTFEEADRVLVVSDHGGRTLHSYVHVGKLLADAGFLRMRTPDPTQGRMSLAMRSGASGIDCPLPSATRS